MADKAMAHTHSKVEDWPNWFPAGVRFCENGHNVFAGDHGKFPTSICPRCGATRFASFPAGGAPGTGFVIPVSRTPLVVKRPWKAVEAYDRYGNRLKAVRQRVKVRVYDVSRVPEQEWSEVVYPVAG